MSGGGCVDIMLNLMESFINIYSELMNNTHNELKMLIEVQKAREKYREWLKIQ